MLRLDQDMAAISAIRDHLVPLSPKATDYDGLLAEIGDARIVMIGEASHGTHEFYEQRCELTRRLIEEKGFRAVAIEADWPDAYQINDYVKGQGAAVDSNAALSGFQRFPTWMWRNLAVTPFIDWLRNFNLGRDPQAQAGVYGIDLYSLHKSVQAVIQYLDETDPEAARVARLRYSCFDHFGQDPQAYGYAASFQYIDPCEDRVVKQLVDLQRQAERYAAQGEDGRDHYFYAEQNARLVLNAERYYRSMFRADTSSWNLRDTHMVDTLQALDQHLSTPENPARIVVWAHNSHLGDARATQMGEGGEVNVGQLVRQRWNHAAFNIGFTTYEGEVTAASDWGGPTERKRVRPGLSESYEALFHAVEEDNFLLILRHNADLQKALAQPRIERAIGVIYRPDTERLSHYFFADLPAQFDAVIHLDHTRGVEPLDREPLWHGDEPAETYPSGI